MRAMYGSANYRLAFSFHSFALGISLRLSVLYLCYLMVTLSSLGRMLPFFNFIITKTRT